MNSNRTALTFTIPLILTAAWTGLVWPATAADWPQWRGPDRSNVSSETGLLKAWPTNGPPLLWQLTGLGEGIASVSVASGRLYTLGYRKDGEYVFAMDAATGQPRWATRIGPAFAENPRMRWLSQRSPTVADDRLYTITRTGELHCLHVGDGRQLWVKSYTNDFGAKMPLFGFGDYPLVDGEKLICTPGAPEASIVALNKETGELLWKSVVPDAGAATYAALVVSEAGRLRQYLTFLERTLVGIDSKDGRLLWRYPRLSQRLNRYTPIVKGDHLFCANAFRENAVALLKIVPEANGLKVEEKYLATIRLDPYQDCTVRVGDHVYAWQISPLCVDMNTGQMLWGRERGRSQGTAAVTAADGHLYYRTSDGMVFLVEASPEAYREKGHFSIPEAVNASGATTPVIADGRLYLRDNDRLFCYEISERALIQARPESRVIAFPASEAFPQSEGVQAAKAPTGKDGAPEAIFVPTPQDIVEKMLELAKVKRDDVVYDLGSGDGRIVMAAAKKYGCKAVGYEIDPKLVNSSRENVQKGNLQELVRIEHEDIFTIDLSGADVVAVYLPSPLLQRLIPQFNKLKPGARIVSHQFELPDFKPDQIITMNSSDDGDKHKLLLWTTPLKKE